MILWSHQLGRQVLPSTSPSGKLTMSTGILKDQEGPEINRHN